MWAYRTMHAVMINVIIPVNSPPRNTPKRVVTDGSFRGSAVQVEFSSSICGSDILDGFSSSTCGSGVHTGIG